MNKQEKSAPRSQTTERARQGKELQEKDASLGRLVAQQNKNEFFEQIIPLLGPLTSYIKRRLRLAYLTHEIGTPVYTSADILDEVLLKAYDSYCDKPEALTLEEWLYQITNERLEKYLRKRAAIEARTEGLEVLEQDERKTLEEIPFTGDAEGEVWFPEELDDSEYESPPYHSPPSSSDPEKQLERQEEVDRLLRAFARLPEQERIVFELFAVEGFSKEAVARICNISPDQVRRIASKVREQLLGEIQENTAKPVQSSRLDGRSTSRTGRPH